MARQARGRSPLTDRPGLLAALALGLLVLAAAAIPEGLALLERDEADRVVLPATPALIRYAIAALGVVLVALMIVLRTTLLPTEEKERSLKSRWRYVALFLVILALWATFSAWRQDPVTRNEGSPQSGSEARRSDEPSSPSEQDRAVEFSETFGYAVGGIFVLALGLTAVALVMLIRRRPLEPLLGPLTQEDLLSEVERGVEELESIEDPRDAVIACYSRMERLIERAGIERRDSDTPFEMLARLLVVNEVTEPSARRLTELFEEAKFSTRLIDEQMRHQALYSLLDVRDRLAQVQAVVR